MNFNLGHPARVRRHLIVVVLVDLVIVALLGHVGGACSDALRDWTNLDLLLLAKAVAAARRSLIGLVREA